MAKIFQKYKFAVLLYLLLISFGYFYIQSLGLKLLSSYINYILYFCSFVLILENLQRSKLNIEIIKLFSIFYFYTSVVLAIPFIFSISDTTFYVYFYLYSDILLSLLILFISIYLFLFSLNLKNKKVSNLIFISLIISVFIIFVNYFEFIKFPYLLGQKGSLYAQKNYLTKLVSILFLVMFWFRYYRKYFILSEYLNIIIFLFMLSNILESLHYIAFQYQQFTIFVYGQFLTLIFNLLIVLTWAVRLEYLESEIGAENEKYLLNFQYLNGLVAKPRSSIFQKLVVKVSLNYLFLFFSLILLAILFLYLANFVNLYLLLNTIFILITAFAAIFLSFSSIKRDWQNQFGFILKKNKQT